MESISNLPEKPRVTFMMCKFDGLSYKEVAARLNISIKTVEGHIGRALKMLREDVQQAVGIGETGNPSYLLTLMAVYMSNNGLGIVEYKLSLLLLGKLSCVSDQYAETIYQHARTLVAPVYRFLQMDAFEYL